MAIREELWECYVSVTICNIELPNEANFSYCMHSINPLFSIVISTIITITTITITTITITITTITITSIGYFTLRLFFHEIYVTPPYQRSPIHCYQLAPSEARSTASSLPPQRSHIVREVRVTIPPLPGCAQRSYFHPYQRRQIHSYQLAPSEATFTPTSDARSTATSWLPAKPDPPLPACSHRS